MTDYFADSSALVKVYILETGSSWMASLARHDSGHRIFVASITPVETMSPVYRRLREGSITEDEATDTKKITGKDFAEVYTVIELNSQIIELAQDLMAKHPLRAYDSVQLATAVMVNRTLSEESFPPLTFLSADKRLIEAAFAEGLPSDNPNDHA